MSVHKRFLSLSEHKIDSILPQFSVSFTYIKHPLQEIGLNAQNINLCSLNKGSTVSITPESLRDQIEGLLQASALPASTILLSQIRNWIGDRWKQLRMKINCRISKLKYLQPTLIGESISVIEKEIKVQWRKNLFLNGLQLLWNNIFRTFSFKNITDIQNFYDMLKEIIAHISFSLFKTSFTQLAKKDYPIMHRLTNITAVNLITSSPQWKNIAESIIKSHYINKIQGFSFNFNLEELNARPQILDPRSEQMFLKTADSLQKLVGSYSLSEIIENLRGYRENLVKQIQTNIENWRKHSCTNKQIILEKQDFLSSIIYTLVRHKLDNMGPFLKYIAFILGKELETVLGMYQVDYYRVDLEVAYQFISKQIIYALSEDYNQIEVKWPSVSV